MRASVPMQVRRVIERYLVIQADGRVLADRNNGLLMASTEKSLPQPASDALEA